jgi:hypothetical protein
MQTPHRRIVAVRRRNPVQLTLREDADHAAVQVAAGARVIGTVPAPPGSGPAVRALLGGPAWLLIVAADVRSVVVGRVWALVPADSGPAETGVLGDEDLVYAVALADVHEARSHAPDLLADVRRLLSELIGTGA